LAFGQVLRESEKAGGFLRVFPAEHLPPANILKRGYEASRRVCVGPALPQTSHPWFDDGAIVETCLQYGIRQRSAHMRGLPLSHGNEDKSGHGLDVVDDPSRVLC
jgi:hypothetical protein